MTDRKQEKMSRSGSVLMVTVLMMSLLLLTVLAFVAVVRMELRNVVTHQERVLAKANARLGIELAIAALQENAGPDRRVTGRSDMDSAAVQRHWTGVWRNPVSPGEDPADPAWRRDDSRKAAPEFVTWLVSGEAPDGSAPDHRAASPFGSQDRQVRLGRVPDPNDPGLALDIYGGKVPLERPGTGDANGSFAYWVEDEGIKAMAGQTNPHVTGLDRLKTFRASQRAGIEILDSSVANIFAPAAAATYAELFDRIRKGTELKFLSASDAQTQSIGRILPHITMASFGVHADTLYGGLKRDLSLAFEADDLTFNNMTDFAAPKPGAAANAPPTSQGGGSEPHANEPVQVKYLFFEKVPDHPAIVANVSNYTQANRADGGAIRGNTWHQLRDYYRAYKQVSNPLGAASMAASAPPRSGNMIYSFSRSNEGHASDLLTQRNYNQGGTDWRPISRPLGNPMVPVLTRERWLHSFRVREGAANGMFHFDFVVSPILTFWNPYNVAITVDELELLKINPVSVFNPEFHSPRTPEESQLGDFTILKGVSRYIENAADSMLLNAFPNLAAAGNTWGLRVRINQDGRSGGGPLTFEPGELKVFAVPGGMTADYDPENPQRYLLFYLEPFQDRGALESPNGLVFEDAWAVDVRVPSGDPVEYASRLARVTETDADGNIIGYNPDLIIGVVSQRQGFQVGNTSDVFLHANGERQHIARHWVRFVQSSTSGDSAGRVQELHAIEAFPMQGIWPGNFTRGTDFPIARGEFVADLYGSQHTVYMTNFFLKPENYSVLYNISGVGRGYDRFPVPVMSHFNPTAPVNWIMTGVRSPHVISDTWDGDTTVLLDWASVPPYPGAFTSTDELVEAGGLGYGGRVYNSGPGGANRMVLREIPTGPILSVGAFRHANLSLYQHLPMYTAGESFPSPYVAPDRVWETGPYNVNNLRRWGSGGPAVNFSTQVDWTYLVNEALWDRYYFSGIAPDPVSNTSLEDALTNFIDGGEPLANARTALIHGRGDLLRDALDPSGEPTAESPVLPSWTTFNRGAFNVNSTSVDAWMAMLSATLGVDVLQRENGSIAADVGFDVPFPRQTIPVSESGEPDTWQTYRGLDASQIETLATALVAEIQRRGPFTSLSDFVNRRLRPAGDPTALGGTLQAALDATSGVNDAAEFTDPAYLRDPDVPPREPRLPANFPYPEHLRGGVLRQAAVSYLTQGDILQVIGPALSARSDTFRIIAYGDALDPLTGDVRARAYAEAVVQRFPDPVFPSADDPFEPENPEQFGRRFRVISFTWLDEEVDSTL